MALIGVIAITVLGALSYASTYLIMTDRRSTAESLAKTQMEYVKSQSYTSAPPGGIANYTKITGIPYGYTIQSATRTGWSLNITGIPWDSGNNTAVNIDVGLQKITVIISYDIVRYNITTRGSELVAKNFTLADYKRQPLT